MNSPSTPNKSIQTHKFIVIDRPTNPSKTIQPIKNLKFDWKQHTKSTKTGHLNPPTVRNTTICIKSSYWKRRFRSQITNLNTRSVLFLNRRYYTKQQNTFVIRSEAIKQPLKRNHVAQNTDSAPRLVIPSAGCSISWRESTQITTGFFSLYVL